MNCSEQAIAIELSVSQRFLVVNCAHNVKRYGVIRLRCLTEISRNQSGYWRASADAVRILRTVVIWEITESCMRET
jgi:hypothetical protein